MMLSEIGVRHKTSLLLAAAGAAVALLGGAATGLWGQDALWWLLAAVCLFAFLAILLTRFQWVLMAFLVLLPLQYMDLAGNRLGIVLSPPRLLLPGLLVGWILYRLRRSRSARSATLHRRLLTPLIALLIVTLLSMIFSQDRSISFGQLLNLAEVVAVFSITVDSNRSETALNRAILAVSLAVGVVAIVQVIPFILSPQQYVTQARTNLESVRSALLFGEPNGEAHFVAILFPLLLYVLYRSASRLHTWMWMALASAAVLAVLLTLSRGGLLALAAGIVVSYRHRISRKVFVLFLILAVVLLATSLLDIWLENINARPGSMTNRLGLWETSLRAAGEYPLLGTGFGTFRTLHRYVSFDWPADLFDRDDPERNKAPHNLYLSMLAETGPLSVLFLGLFWWRLVARLRHLGRWTRRARMMREWWLIQFLTGCCAAFLVSRVFTTSFFVYAFWILLALLIAATSVVSRQMEMQYRSGQSPIR